MSRAPRLTNDCFALPQGVDWTEVDDALARLEAAATCVAEVETIPLMDAGGRILAGDLTARIAHPPWANAAVDGYGFAHPGGAAREIGLPLAPGRAAAGAPFTGAVPDGAALRILTGAPIPDGVDTVVLQEDVGLEDGRVWFRTGLKTGSNIRRAGENVAKGGAIAPAGRALRPEDLAQATAGGLGEIAVRRRLRVAVLSTGDEITPPGAPLAPGALHDANRPMLLDLVRRLGMEPVDLAIAPDEAGAVRAALDLGAERADAILATGGASSGDEDHLARELGRAGARHTWRIAIKPGRPLALGQWGGVPVFGLPGNPVAALVCALLFAAPVLRRMSGERWPTPRRLRLPAAFAKSKRAGRREFPRARLTANGAVELFRSEGSGLIGGLTWAEGLVDLPHEAVEIAPGDPVDFLPWSAFLP